MNKGDKVWAKHDGEWWEGVVAESHGPICKCKLKKKDGGVLQLAFMTKDIKRRNDGDKKPTV